MEPLLAFAAEFWWLGPVVIGGGAASVAGVRAGRRTRERNIEFAAAKYELDVARRRLRTAKADQKSAEAALLVAKSDRQRGLPVDTESPRRRLADAQREFRAAQTEIRGRRTQVQAARTLLHGPAGDADQLPLPRLVAAHDAVIGRWMAYETDPAKAIAFPAMVDATQPATAALLTAMDQARWLRPASPRERITPEAFARYRAAVTAFHAAFEAAERAAWRQAGAGSPTGTRAMPSVPTELREAWSDWVQTAKTTATAALSSATATALEAMSRVRPPEASAEATGRAPGSPATPRPTPPSPPAAEPTAEPAPPPTSDRPSRIWPVPRRMGD